MKINLYYVGREYAVCVPLEPVLMSHSTGIEIRHLCPEARTDYKSKKTIKEVAKWMYYLTNYQCTIGEPV